MHNLDFSPLNQAFVIRQEWCYGSCNSIFFPFQSSSVHLLFLLHQPALPCKLETSWCSRKLVEPSIGDQPMIKWQMYIWRIFRQWNRSRISQFLKQIVRIEIKFRLNSRQFWSLFRSITNFEAFSTYKVPEMMVQKGKVFTQS